MMSEAHIRKWMVNDEDNDQNASTGLRKKYDEKNT